MSFLTMRALLFMAECLLASLLLPLLAFAVTRLLRRAALRHLAWMTLFGVLALLPLAALLLPARQIVLTEPAAVAAPVESAIALPPVEMIAPLPEAPGEKRVTAPEFKVNLLPVPAMAAPVPALAPAEPLLTPANALLLLVLLWAAGLAWNLARMGLGMIGLARLRRESELFQQNGFEIRLSSGVTGPATFGILRPLVLLPEAARQWSPARLAAVLAHEAAHVRRRDIAGQSLARLVCAVFWFNPLLWLAARALRQEAEIAADDAVLAGGMTPSAYAAELVALASEILGPPPALRGLGAGMADSPLMTRVQSVLAADISRKGVTGMDIARTLSLGLAATLLLAVARFDLALAQEKPANPAPVARPAPAAPSPAPQVNIEVDRSIERKVDAEVEAIKARADAATAEAKARASAERDPAKRAQYREEAARVAEAAGEMKARADEMRQRMAAWQVSMKEQQLMQEAERQMLAEHAADVGEKAKEAQQRALEARRRAADIRTKAEEANRRMRELLERQSALSDRPLLPLQPVPIGPLSQLPVPTSGRVPPPPAATLSDEAVLAAARQRKITVSPFDVNERLRTHHGQSDPFAAPESLRNHAIVELALEQLVALQAADAAMPADGRMPAAQQQEMRRLSTMLRAPGALGTSPYTRLGIVSRRDPGSSMRTLVGFTPVAVLDGREDLVLQSDDVVRVLSLNEVAQLKAKLQDYRKARQAEEQTSRSSLDAASAVAPAFDQLALQLGVDRTVLINFLITGLS